METLSLLQLRVMRLLWRNGTSTVSDVHDALNAQPDAHGQLAIATVMRSLARLGFLEQKPEGRAHRFTPLIAEDAYELEMVRRMRVDLFGGDAGQMLTWIAEDDGIDASKRKRIKDLACS